MIESAQTVLLAHMLIAVIHVAFQSPLLWRFRREIAFCAGVP